MRKTYQTPRFEMPGNPTQDQRVAFALGGLAMSVEDCVAEGATLEEVEDAARDAYDEAMAEVRAKKAAKAAQPTTEAHADACGRLRRDSGGPE